MTGSFETASAESTRRAGKSLARFLRPGDVVALAGDLGAGKTQLVGGVATGLGVDEPVTSPTFNLLLVHPGALPLYHFDLYRLEREAELEDLAFYETLEGDGVSVIEWGDRFPRALPADHLLVTIRRRGPEDRVFELLPSGSRSAELAREWMGALAAQGNAP
ncbi:MAG: tRNA (adenosine(37)-N6)-threonylcarbamoyltransferase complex ATPase subunit type 1 TsaE [Actinobacteria bacterium]|nr:tRNA (adenosine(37)-N6)-threonylcarbamoyltransferase complex ATPase subunit type 1 TsaE [Actinomycetota bacterium]